MDVIATMTGLSPAAWQAWTAEALAGVETGSGWPQETV